MWEDASMAWPMPWTTLMKKGRETDPRLSRLDIAWSVMLNGVDHTLTCIRCNCLVEYRFAYVGMCYQCQEVMRTAAVYATRAKNVSISRTNNQR